MSTRKFLLLCLLSLVAFSCTACLPLVLAVWNNNNNNNDGTSSSSLGAISGTLSPPATTSSTLASIKGAITNFTGFTASLIDNNVTLQTVNVDAVGNFRFNNVTPKAGYKIRAVKNRIELLLYTETTFLPGQTLAVILNTTSTARALIYESLLGTVAGLTQSQITSSDVASLVNTLDTVFTSSTNQFTYSTQTVLTLTSVLQMVATVKETTQSRLAGTTTSTSTTTTTGALDPATATRQDIDRNGDGVKDSATTYTAETGYGPFGQEVTFVNFTPSGKIASVAMTATPMKAYYFRLNGAGSDLGNPVVPYVPGQTGYNDFWQKVIVNVKSTYVANLITTASNITTTNAYINSITETTDLVNCPMVAEGSSIYSGGSTLTGYSLGTGWYGGKVIKYFTLGTFTAKSDGSVPLANLFLPGSGSNGSQKWMFNYVSGETNYSDLFKAQTLATSTLYTRLSKVFSKIYTKTTRTGVTLGDPTYAYYNCPAVSPSYTKPSITTEASVTRNGATTAQTFNTKLWIFSSGSATGTMRVYDFGYLTASKTSSLFYTFKNSSTGEDVTNQNAVFATKPTTDSTYNDFHQEYTVSVPANSVAALNMVSEEDVTASEYTLTNTGYVVNRPIVPSGSTLGSSSHTLKTGWYKETLVKYWAFGRSQSWDLLSAKAIPIAPIFYRSGQASITMNAPTTSSVKSPGTASGIAVPTADHVSGYSDMVLLVNETNAVTMKNLSTMFSAWNASRSYPITGTKASQTWTAKAGHAFSPDVLSKKGSLKNMPCIYSNNDLTPP